MILSPSRHGQLPRVSRRSMTTTLWPPRKTLSAAIRHQRPAVIDPFTVGSLIVAVATLAWTVYADQRKKDPDASDDTLESTIRVECRKFRRLSTRPGETSAETEITEYIATEITRVGRKLR